MTEMNINKCLNCGEPVNVRTFLYDSPRKLSG
jgi:recombinational DNA repair protein (RecF pathway)